MKNQSKFDYIKRKISDIKNLFGIRRKYELEETKLIDVYLDCGREKLIFTSHESSEEHYPYLDDAYEYETKTALNSYYKGLLNKVLTQVYQTQPSNKTDRDIELNENRNDIYSFKISMNSYKLDESQYYSYIRNGTKNSILGYSTSSRLQEFNSKIIPYYEDILSSEQSYYSNSIVQMQNCVLQGLKKCTSQKVVNILKIKANLLYCYINSLVVVDNDETKLFVINYNREEDSYDQDCHYIAQLQENYNIIDEYLQQLMVFETDNSYISENDFQLNLAVSYSIIYSRKITQTFNQYATYILFALMDNYSDELILFREIVCNDISALRFSYMHKSQSMPLFAYLSDLLNVEISFIVDLMNKYDEGETDLTYLRYRIGTIGNYDKMAEYTGEEVLVLHILLYSQ